VAVSAMVNHHQVMVNPECGLGHAIVKDDDRDPRVCCQQGSGSLITVMGDGHCRPRPPCDEPGLVANRLGVELVELIALKNQDLLMRLASVSPGHQPGLMANRSQQVNQHEDGRGLTGATHDGIANR
ncbi:MAG: hypothetical protein RLZZ166_559, partial [Pseudomonadota bacterium]